MDKEFEEMYDEFNKIFALPGMFSGSALGKVMAEVPAAKMYNTASKVPSDIINVTNEEGEVIEWRTSFAMAGIDPESISVKVIANRLQIKASYKREADEKIIVKKNGISKKDLDVTLELAPRMDKKAVKYSLREGLLTVRVPIAAEETFTAERM